MLPLKFKERMRPILMDEYDAFIEALEKGDSVRGVRANLIKCHPNDLLSSSNFELTKTGYSDNGFILENDIQIGNTPEHHSGMIYVQDPGAMATLAALDIKSDWWVADLCSAPGGKSSQIAERLGDGGFLLSNEYVPKRAKIIVGNFERLGVCRAIVTSLDTHKLAQLYHNTFDLVLVDTPCSGEGMFRKSDEALSEWSEENIAACAKRQAEILNNAAGMVKSGGYLLYSTCTYSPEENEIQIASFLEDHADFHLHPVKDSLAKATSPGINKYGKPSYNMKLCRRCYPHVLRGEGQFIALLKRDEIQKEEPKIAYKDSSKPLTKQEKATIEQFFKDNMKNLPKGRLVKVGENPVLIQHGCPLPPSSVFMSGILLGEIRGKLLIPSHQLFSALGKQFIRQETLSAKDQRVQMYMRGEEIEASDKSVRGWCAVMYEGVALGGGKMSDGRIKNHYPKGLRLK